MDTQDPNVVENYEQEPQDSVPDPTPEKEVDPNTSHPLVAMLLRQLRVYPHIERYTLLLDVLENTAEFRIILAKQSSQAPKARDYERRR